MPVYSSSSFDDDDADDDASFRSPSDDGTDSAGAARSWPEAESITPSLLTQEEVDGLSCMSELSKDFIARPAGNLRVCSPPPPGHVCVYPCALEAGFCCTKTPPRLQAFFCEVLSHFSLAPSQLAPNGWRNVAHFYKLCGSAGVRPSLALFRQFFRLWKTPKGNATGWYHFRSKYISLPAPAAAPNINWKEDYFFLSSPAPWTCPVQWGEPSEESKILPEVEDDETAAVLKVLGARGSASVDTTNTMLVKAEQRGDNDIYTDSPERSPSSGRKRSLEEANTPLLQVLYIRNRRALFIKKDKSFV